MGLDSFKTDGPRTYKKNSTSTGHSTKDSIHIVKGMDDSAKEFLKIHEVHTVFKAPESMNIELPQGPPYFICSDCGKIAGSYETMVKTDLVDFHDYDWVDEAKSHLLDAFTKVPKDEYYDASIEEVELEEDSDETEDKDVSSSSGEELNSGLDSFLS